VRQTLLLFSLLLDINKGRYEQLKNMKIVEHMATKTTQKAHIEFQNKKKIIRGFYSIPAAFGCP
jgi:hypothetical protein